VCCVQTLAMHIADVIDDYVADASSGSQWYESATLHAKLRHLTVEHVEPSTITDDALDATWRDAEASLKRHSTGLNIIPCVHTMILAKIHRIYVINRNVHRYRTTQ